MPRGQQLKSALAAQPAQIAFYVGLQDSRFLAMNGQYDASLRRTGIGHIFDAYQGGHTLSLWRSQAPTWLAWALRYLAAARGHQPG